MRNDRIEMLQDTLQILEKGFYNKNGRMVRLKLSRQEMEKVCVVLPNHVKHICSRRDFMRACLGMDIISRGII